MSWLALDIGGANLKAASGRGYAASRPFELWRAPERLLAELEPLIEAAPHATQLAITMTGELADCYETKATGVRAILEAVKTASGARSIAVYLADGTWATLDDAWETPLSAAASNWRALAAFANRYVSSWPALLMDMGSTTTDIVPLSKSGPCPADLQDPDRLISGELAYTGIERTPISAIVQRLPWRGGACPVAAELFATVADAHLLLGDLSEEAQNTETADGRPRTKQAAHSRMARMICADATMYSISDAMLGAAAVRDAQIQLLEEAVRRVAGRLGENPRTIILSGHGEFLLRKLVARLPWDCEVKSLSVELGAEISRCAPAHGLAVLAVEAWGNQARG